MALKPCLVCGEPSPGPRCPEHPEQTSHQATATQRGYDSKWSRLSRRARRLQPWCLDCHATEDLSADHSPEAWRRHERGLPIRLEDIEVVCLSCNTKRGAARGDGVGRGHKEPRSKPQTQMRFGTIPEKEVEQWLR